MKHQLSIGDLVSSVITGRFGIVKSIDWDNPRNHKPVTVELNKTRTEPKSVETFSFSELKKHR